MFLSSDMSALFARVAEAPGFDSQISLLSEDTRKRPLFFEHIHPAGTAFLIALLTEYIARVSPHRRIWIIAPQQKRQEALAGELPLWLASSTEKRRDILFIPEQEHAVNESVLSDPEPAAERLALLQTLSSPPSGIQTLILTKNALSQDAPRATDLASESRVLRVGDSLSDEVFTRTLEEAGFERCLQVVSRNQWARRGGIIDFFPPQAARPVRVEFFGDEIDSLREFDIDTQVSVKKREFIPYLLNEPKGNTPLSDWIGAEDFIISTQGADVEADALFSEGSFGVNREGEAVEEDFSTAIYGEPLGFFDAGDFVLQEVKRQAVQRQLHQWLGANWNVSMMFANNGEENRFREMVVSANGDSTTADLPSPNSSSGTPKTKKGKKANADGTVPAPLPLPNEWSRVSYRHAPLPHGFTVPGARLAILSSSELFGRFQAAYARRQANREDKARQIRAQASLKEISPGDLVVHLHYGIGRYLRIEKEENGDEQMVLEYKDQVLLRLPLTQSHLVSRYVGMGKKSPDLNKIGDGRWARSWKAAEKAVNDFAAQLLSVQAEREAKGGYSHPPDSRWMWEFENSFPYRETPDQLRAISQTKADMESTQPMDRLICGDVGFGKTEVAIRAAFKCVTGGKQAVLLAPTTVLAEQHCRTFRERMSEYPVRIELLSRFRTAAEQKRTLAGLANGSVDIVIGTHRLISDDVIIKNPGIVIIDEEQRFGVKHKERFKERFRSLDILTLSATPIPRTLYLALMGARDMSTIDTAPPNRLPVHTGISSYDERLIKKAIEKELDRGGQVYFLHNRVKTIEHIKKRLQDLVPQARIVVGHGQMDKNELEEIMHLFVKGEADILLATTIIESGIDIPNANTIIIDRADRFGLADLYQLRGRVGRSGHQAYAYLLLPRKELTTGDARKRINAIKQYTELGSGFKIAMRDLEIRGAGNLLGTQQSGHIAAIGFDLYCQLLRQSIDQSQGKQTAPRVECNLKADFLLWGETQSLQAQKDGLGRATVGAYFPADYLPDSTLRISAYKSLSQANSLKELDQLADTWKDRFGSLPLPVKNLLLCHKIKTIASLARITQVEIRDQRLMLTRNGEYILLANKIFPKLTKGRAADKLAEAFQMLEKL